MEKTKNTVHGRFLGRVWRKVDILKGCFQDLKEYQRLMERAKEDFKSSSSFLRASLGANPQLTARLLPSVFQNIDEILALPHSPEDFESLDVLPSDSDSWLYDGEDELNSELLQRQKEMENYNMKHKSKENAREQQDDDASTSKSSRGSGGS